jgi:hypothetical protein
MARFTSFDDWSAWMQTVIKENGVGAITGPVMQEVLAELSDTAEYLVNISGSSADGRALAAEGYAVGTQRGVPVEEGSPYYHNNAKYWAEVVASRAAELGELTAEARQAIDDANAAVRAAAGAAHDATEAAGLANEKSAEAAAAASLANEKSAEAAAAATLANTKAGYAEEQGNYARDQINGAKGDYESLDERFDHVDEISMYFEETGTTADPQLIDEYDRTLRKAYQCITDMQVATDAANRSAARAELAGRHADDMANKSDAAARQCVEQTQRAAAAADAAEQATTDATNAAGDALNKSRMAETAAGTADARAQYALEQGNYSKEQGDYAKRMGEALEDTGCFFEEAPLL